MGDLADVFEETRRDVISFVESLSEEDLQRRLPGAPEWTVRDVIAHLAGDANGVNEGDFPRQFFESFGDEAAVVVLNRWTQGHVDRRKDMTLAEVIKEWDESAARIVAMMRGDQPMPEEVPPFADRVLLTDLAVHQQDIFGAFGIDRGRDAAPIRIATPGYVAIMGLRLATDGIAPLRLDAGDKVYQAGEGEPGATVKAPSRFEFFRALSGRRNPEQILAYEWEGDPEPYVPYFYPYGVRAEALVE
jgi:uncharacterized protein (TIGR03083 family)